MAFSLRALDGVGREGMSGPSSRARPETFPEWEGREFSVVPESRGSREGRNQSDGLAA